LDSGNRAAGEAWRPTRAGPKSHTLPLTPVQKALVECDLVHLLHTTVSAIFTAILKGRSSNLPAIFDFLYREYCGARLAEMRKQLLLIRAENIEVSEANCDASHPDRAPDHRSSFIDPEREAGHSRSH